jgi:hypothetical protein
MSVARSMIERIVTRPLGLTRRVRGGGPPAAPPEPPQDDGGGGGDGGNEYVLYFTNITSILFYLNLGEDVVKARILEVLKIPPEVVTDFSIDKRDGLFIALSKPLSQFQWSDVDKNGQACAYPRAEPVLRAFASEEYDYDPHDSSDGLEPEATTPLTRYLLSCRPGLVAEINGERYVYVDGVCRGDHTHFLANIATNELFYVGENPDRPSDGMVMDSPYNSASYLGDSFSELGTVWVGKYDHEALKKAVELHGEMNWHDKSEDDDY